MSITPAPTIENFYKFCAERKLMGVTCTECKKVIVPPRSLCPHCGSSQMNWTELPDKGKLVTYTVIHVSPIQFQELSPYAVGIVEFGEGVRLPGMIREVKSEDLRIGMELGIDFDTSVPTEWPRWPRYFFRKT